MPTVLNYEVNNNVSNPSNFIDKLKDFAIANGWTLFDQKKDLAWAWDGSKYDFVTASAGENYIELHILCCNML